MSTIELRREYVSIHGAPRIRQVDTDIFQLRYFVRCMECTFCHDSCCQYGVDVDAENVARMRSHADALETFTKVPRDRWFTDEWTNDHEYPGGKNTRTRVEDGTCVFLRRKDGQRGCALHAYCLTKGLDYHELKPMMSSLFPLSFLEGLLCAAEEAETGELACSGQGETLYRGARDEVAHYFGAELVAELDAIEASLSAARA